MAKPPVPNKEAEEVVRKQIAALALLGKPAAEIATELNISAYMVRKTMQSDAFKDLMKSYGDEAVTNARNHLRSQAESLAPKVWSAIKRLVESDKGKDAAEGIKAYYRLIGLEKAEGEQGPANLVIQLPGVKSETVIEVEKETQDDEADA
jgi:hypothetical protein